MGLFRKKTVTKTYDKKIRNQLSRRAYVMASRLQALRTFIQVR